MPTYEGTLAHMALHCDLWFPHVACYLVVGLPSHNVFRNGIDVYLSHLNSAIRNDAIMTITELHASDDIHEYIMRTSGFVLTADIRSPRFWRLTH